MEEYKEKLEKLSLQRLKDLVKAYEKTIQSHEVTLREATIVGMGAIIEYNQKELEKKKAELAEIAKVIAEKEVN